MYVVDKPSNIYRLQGNPMMIIGPVIIHGVSPQFLQPFSIDSAGFPCRDPVIPTPGIFHGVKICSARTARHRVHTTWHTIACAHPQLRKELPLSAFHII